MGKTFENQNLRLKFKRHIKKADRLCMKTQNIFKKGTYFQFNPSANYPVFIFLENKFMDTNFFKILKELQFVELTEEQLKSKAELFSNSNFRLLNIKEASVKVSQQILRSNQDDRFGPESITELASHKVYRYKSQALVVFSYRFKEWEMGCFANFGNEKSTLETKMVLHRYLSWSLSVIGVVGFWGVPVEEGVVINKPSEVKAEAVYFDLKRLSTITIEGEKKVGSNFKIIRLDTTLTNRNIILKREELIGFLFTHSTFLDYRGPSIPVRQVIQEISQLATGILHPEKSFKPRMNLSM